MRIYLSLIFILLFTIKSYSINYSYYPTNNIVIAGSNMDFKWNVILKTNRYRLNISTSNTMSPLFYSDSSITNTFSNVTLIPNTYYWQISADTGNGFNVLSSVLMFQIIDLYSIDSLALWVKADNIIPGVGDSVSIWNDISINNFIATQSLSGKKPVLEYNTLNHLPSVKFDGVDDNLSFGIIPLNVNLGYSFFTINSINNSPANTRAVFGEYTGSSQGNASLRISNTNKPGLILDTEVKTGTTTLINNKNYLYSFIANLDSGNLYLNKNLEFKYVPTVDLVGVSALGFTLGSIATGTYWKDNISELIIFKKRVSNLEKTQVESYLMDKYAPPINLGKDIITCSTATLLSAKNDESYISYLWNTGSTDSAITISTSGTYSVRVTDLFNRVSFDTINLLIDNVVYSSLHINDTQACVGTVLNISAGPSHLHYLWSNGDTNNITSINTGGTYWVSVTDCQGNILKDTFNVIQQDLSFNLGNDTVICAGQAVFLQVPIIGSSIHYLWNNGSTNSSINAINTGLYWCNVFDTLSRCYYSDTIFIFVIGVENNFIYYPTNNSTIPTHNVTFLWNHVQKHIKYKIIISNNNLLSPILYTDSLVTGSSYNHSLSSNSYYWQVVADTGTGFNIFSSVFKFTVFNPSSIDSLALWVKADDIIAGVGDSVSIWEDNSSNGYDAIQNTSIKKPILIQNTLNHLPSVSFDGIDDNLSCGIVPLNINLEYSFFTINNVNNSPLTTRALFGEYLGSSQGNAILRINNLNKLGVIFDTESKTGTTTIQNNKNYLYSYVANIDSASLYINRNVEVNYIPTVDMIGSTLLPFNIGSISSSSYWSGSISELMIYKRRITNVEKNNVENYLMDKYAPPINLGADIVRCLGSNITLNAKNDGSYISYLWNTGSTDSAISVNNTGIYTVQVVDIFDRVSIDTIIVKFDNVVYSSLTMNDTAVCLGTNLDISAGPSHLSYLWSTGDTTNIANFSTGGTYWVSLTDCYNNSFADTFTISQIDNRFNLGNDTTLCFGNAVLLSPTTSRPVSYLWSTGAITPTIIANTANTFWCRIQDSILGCFTSDSIIINIDSFSFLVDIGNDTSLCNGNTLAIATGNSYINNILWSTLDTTLTTIVTTDGDYSFVAYDSLGCIKRDTVNVRIKGNAPYVDFIVNNLCEGDTLKPINLSTTIAPDVIRNYTWTFGDGYSDTVFAPIHYFDTSGTYTINLIALTDSGCSNFNSYNISYSKNPIARIASLIVCAGKEVTLSDASIIPVGYTISSRSWNVNSTTATTPSINYTFPLEGKYPINYTITTSGGCSDTYNDSFEVFPAINLDFNYTGECLGDTTKFNDITGSFSIIQREWIFGLGLGYAFNISNPKMLFPTAGSYLVSYKAKNAIGCIDSIVKYIKIFSLPTAFFEDSIACFNSVKTFTDQSSSFDDTINYWHWLIDTNNYFSQNINHISNTNSSYPASLEVQTIHGCKDIYNRNITISNPPTADFSFTPNYGEAPLLINFINNSIGATSYLWYFNDSFNSTSNLNSPTFTYLNNQIFNVVLIAINNDGCEDSVLKSITVQPSELDLKLENINLYETNTNSGYKELKVSVRLINVGSRIISNAKLLARIENGTIISEYWTGNLMPGQYQDYIFNASFLISNDDINRYICAEAIEVNDSTETKLSNNKICKNNHSQGVTSEIYPNPSNQSANVDVVLVQATDVNIEVYNELGQTIFPSQTFVGNEGLNHFMINTNILSDGQYYIRVKYFTSDEKRKFQISR